MRKWFDETLHTISVTTYHPLGWGLQRIQQRLIGEELPIKASDTLEHHPPVVLVHGIFHNATAFYRFERTLKKRGFDHVSSFELWTSLKNVQSLANRLKAQVFDSVQKASDKAGRPLKARVIAHSLGGMVARVALLDPSFCEQVDKVIFLGTPHQGSGFYRFPLPRCLRDLSHGSHIMNRLKSEPLAGGVRYWNLRGELDIITPRNSTFLPHVPNLSFEGIGHAGLLSDPQVVQSVIDILELDRPNERQDAARVG